MQVIATKTGSELKLTKREKSLLEDCKTFVELLGKHGDKGMADDAVKVVRGIAGLQFAIDPPPKEELPY